MQAFNMAAPWRTVHGVVRLVSNNVHTACCRCRCSYTNEKTRILVRHIGSTSRAPVVQAVKSKYWPVALASGLAVGYVIGRGRYAWSVPILPEVEAAKPFEGGDSAPPLTSRTNFNFIADVVEIVAPAVVYIEIQGSNPMTGMQGPVSNGSGFIVREDGLIITNAHVVANKQSVKVHLHSGDTYEGWVQAVDPVSDLATLKINAKNLPVLKLGDSASLRTGEWVVAVGSPFSLSNTVTAGIVSTTQRKSKELGIRNKDIDYIQTDALITFGHSGGPLINLNGEVIGINTMKVTTGISFAIPIDYAKTFLSKADAIEKRGQPKGWFGFGSQSSSEPSKSKRRYMGITMLTLTPSIIQELKLRHQDFPANVESGVLVHKVVVGSPAFNGGLRPGDIITKINGKDVSSSTDVYSAVESQKSLNISVQRGSEKTILAISPEDLEY